MFKDWFAKVKEIFLNYWNILRRILFLILLIILGIIIGKNLNNLDWTLAIKNWPISVLLILGTLFFLLIKSMIIFLGSRIFTLTSYLNSI